LRRYWITASALPAVFIRFATSAGVDPEASEDDILSGVALEEIVDTAESIDEVLGGGAVLSPCSDREEAADPAIVGMDLVEEIDPAVFCFTAESETLRLSSGWRGDNLGL
jgi:hypothetical protein